MNNGIKVYENVLTFLSLNCLDEDFIPRPNKSTRRAALRGKSNNHKPPYIFVLGYAEIYFVTF